MLDLLTEAMDATQVPSVMQLAMRSYIKKRSDDELLTMARQMATFTDKLRPYI